MSARSAVYFLIAMALGGTAALRSWDGVIFLYLDDSRAPSAIHRELDISALRGADLMLASQKRLVSEAKLLKRSDSLGIQLGQFVLRNEKGIRTTACRVFDRVTLEFVAEGLIENGEAPSMTIEGSCSEAHDISQLEPLWIPVQRIVAESPGDMELQFWDQEPVRVRFQHLGLEWPMHWRLNGVQLSSSNQMSTPVGLDHQDIRKLLDSPIRMNWTEALARTSK